MRVREDTHTYKSIIKTHSKLTHKTGLMEERKFILTVTWIGFTPSSHTLAPLLWCKLILSPTTDSLGSEKADLCKKKIHFDFYIPS